MGLLLGVVWATGLLLTGCDQVQNPVLEPRDLDEAFFSCDVQPVLARECSFPGCHGSTERPFAVYSPGRMRMSAEYGLARRATPAEDIEAGVHPSLTPVERNANYVQAMAFVRPDGSRQASQLLTRPLTVAAGGVYHAPGGDIFQSPSDPGYTTILRWLDGATAAEACP
jgi:hypothetical protein